MANEKLGSEAEAYSRLLRLRDALRLDPPRVISEKLDLAIAKLRIMLATHNQEGVVRAVRHADAVLAICEAWRERAPAPAPASD
jgi:hypothetical protein